MKNFIKKLIPPILLELKPKEKYGFFGDYKSWPEALAHSSGYDNPEILEKVKNSLLKVKNGEVAYERDSVIFDKKQYSWPVLASLLWIASKNGNKLNVLDFGGSLGSSYFQNKEWLLHLSELKWSIVEQKNFTECGQKYFEDEHLKFYENINKCLQKESPFVFLASSSIQYVEKPYELLDEINKRGFEFLIFDRTAFLEDKNRVTVQKVRPGIYDASYPAWFLNERKFLGKLGENYELIAEFDSLAGKIKLDGAEAREKGFIFKKK